jgi:hypothetical protein
MSQISPDSNLIQIAVIFIKFHQTNSSGDPRTGIRLLPTGAGLRA